jgi:hypothetical protein
VVPCSRGFVVPDLDDMDVGTVQLRVPVMNDAIQVGASGDLPAGAIMVSKYVNSASIRRMDRRPIQAQVIRRTCSGSIARTAVFRHPVRQLNLLRTGTRTRHGMWVARGIADDDRHEELMSFIAVVATFSLAKQRRIGRDPLGR